MKSFTGTPLATALGKSPPLQKDFEYPVVRAAMVVIFLFFGYTKWHPYAAETLMPFIKNGPLISWLYPAFGIVGATKFLGGSEWIICALLFSGFWDKRLGILGALGSCATFVATVTIIPFMPGGWAASAGGFPAMTGSVAFLMKDVVLLAASFYLLKQDAVRVSLDAEHATASGKSDDLSNRRSLAKEGHRPPAGAISGTVN